jgi:hypothetical protein
MIGEGGFEYSRKLFPGASARDPQGRLCEVGPAQQIGQAMLRIDSVRTFAVEAQDLARPLGSSSSLIGPVATR